MLGRRRRLINFAGNFSFWQMFQAFCFLAAILNFGGYFE